MPNGIPSTLYQTRAKRRHYVEHGQSMYGKMGAAGPAISAITGEVLVQRKPKKLGKKGKRK